MNTAHSHDRGLVRREFLQVGFSGFLGLGLPGLLAKKAAAETATGRAKSVLLIFLTGGPSHLDTFDLKPEAAEGIRGEYKPIATKIPGVSFSEHLPGLAARADKLAVVRSMSHTMTNHLNGTHEILTGQKQPNAFFDKVASRDDYPCYASALSYLRPRSDGVPSGVMLPTFLVEGPLTWPGQHAGVLGPKHDPWQIRRDPNKADFRDDSLSLPVGFSVERIQNRRRLMDDLSAQQDSLAERAASDPMAAQRDSAYSLLLSGKVARAFDLHREDPRTRDRYGRHQYGQSLLLARRLIQAGVPVVQANIGHVQTWDSHEDIFRRLKQDLLPPTDQALSALLDDMSALGLLDDTLVILTGEFGRTPKISKLRPNAIPGRDHWARAFTSVFAGGGVRGGQVIGQTDKNGAYPASRSFAPKDLAATVYSALGIEPDAEIRDRLGRPLKLCDGARIEPLYTGASTI